MESNARGGLGVLGEAGGKMGGRPVGHSAGGATAGNGNPRAASFRL